MDDINWAEYDSAATWCAKRGIKGTIGDSLPTGLSTAVVREIHNNYEAFEHRVRETAYALAMSRIYRDMEAV